ncbi:MAG: hypothetical protein K5899_09715 [Bacteroidaceae bacterium]|nr:hypothetical protein [Bacteroidaceae bacterium]
MNNAIKREQLSLFELPSVSILREAKRILLILFTLLPVGAMGQVEKTSRLEVLQRTPTIKNGIDYSQKLINTFKYEANPSAEYWYTKDKYFYHNFINVIHSRLQEMKRSYAERGDTALLVDIKEYEAKTEDLDSIYEYYETVYTKHKLLFLTSPSFGEPAALAYTREEKTELIAMKSHESIWYNIDKRPILTTVRMEVDRATLDSILNLTVYAVYTSVYRDTKTVVLDGVSNFLFWREKESKFSAEGDGMQRLLAQTYNDILKAVLDNDKEKLKSLAPTINRLLAHYRSLQLPDQYISRWFSS